MKNNSTYKNLIRPAQVLVLMTLCAGIISSCKKPDLVQYNKGNMPLVITTSKDSLVLKQAEDANDALTISWTPGSNHGTNSSISYTLKIDKKGNNFGNPVKIEMGTAVFEKKYSVKELNNLLITRLHLPPNEPGEIEARVIADITAKAGDADSSEIMEFTVVPYKPVTATLYLIGDATPNGWDSNLATEMIPDKEVSGKFTWEGNLSSGNMKFITTIGQFLPSYNKGSNSQSLLYRDNDAQPDDQFLISTPGGYHITVDLLNLSITIEASTKPPYTRLWMLGDAIPSGWNIDTPDEMRVDSSNLFIFKYNSILAAGEFKIPTATGNFTTDYYMPLTDHPEITNTGVQLVHNGSPDLKWKITDPGPYKITLDLQSLKINIKPFTPYAEIWMVGDATPVGWNIDNPQPMTADPSDPYIFTYTGPMTAGEFKFPVGKGNWGGDFFMPEVNHQDLGSHRVKFVPGGNPDNKWQIITAGNYKIVLNQLKETIEITKM